MQPITRFSGTTRFLSTFWPVWINRGGIFYPSVEHAYQAEKVLDILEKISVAEAPTPRAAKRLGRKLEIRPDWEEIKLSVMLELLQQKFAPNTFLAAKLWATRGHDLVEGNTWGDTFWGQCPVGFGQNHLGRLLMTVREALPEQAPQTIRLRLPRV